MGNEHELLNVETAIGVFAAVYDVEGRLGERKLGVVSEGSEMSKELGVSMKRRGAGKSEGNAEDRVRAEARFVGSAVERDQCLIECTLVVLIAAKVAVYFCVYVIYS